MKTKLSKTEAKEKISQFFKKKNFSHKELKKIKRLAMKFNIKLTPYRKLFCNSCLNHLEGKIKVTKAHKTIVCKNCKNKNKFKII